MPWRLGDTCCGMPLVLEPMIRNFKHWGNAGDEATMIGVRSPWDSVGALHA